MFIYGILYRLISSLSTIFVFILPNTWVQRLYFFELEKYWMKYRGLNNI